MIENITMIVEHVVPKWAKNRRKIPICIELSGLPDDPAILDIASWKWRSLNGLKNCLKKMFPDRQIDLATFRPEITSEGRHTRFVWLNFALVKQRVVVNANDIKCCNFEEDQPRVVTLVPMNWARAVIALAKSGVDRIEKHHAVLSSGESGILTTVPPIFRN